MINITNIANSNMIPKNSYIYRNIVILLYKAVIISALKYAEANKNELLFCNN